MSEPEWSLIDNNSGQDNAAWISQGPITDRWNENLGLSDRGVNLYRKLLEANILKAQRGEDPMNVFRDPATNICLELPVEDDKGGISGQDQQGMELSRAGNSTKYSPLLTAAEEALAAAGSRGS